MKTFKQFFEHTYSTTLLTLKCDDNFNNIRVEEVRDAHGDPSTNFAYWTSLGSHNDKSSLDECKQTLKMFITRYFINSGNPRDISFIELVHNKIISAFEPYSHYKAIWRVVNYSPSQRITRPQDIRMSVLINSDELIKQAHTNNPLGDLIDF